jgi:hypothetical protein
LFDQAAAQDLRATVSKAKNAAGRSSADTRQWSATPRRVLRERLLALSPDERFPALAKVLSDVMMLATEIAYEPYDGSVGDGRVPENDRKHAKELVEILYPIDVGLVPYVKAYIGPVLSGARTATKNILKRNPDEAAFIEALGSMDDVLRQAVCRRVERGTTTAELAPMLRAILIARGSWLSKDIVEDRMKSAHPLDARIAAALTRYAVSEVISSPKTVAHREPQRRGSRGRAAGEQDCRCSSCLTGRIIRRATAVVRAADEGCSKSVQGPSSSSI